MSRGSTCRCRGHVRSSHIVASAPSQRARRPGSGASIRSATDADPGVGRKTAMHQIRSRVQTRDQLASGQMTRRRADGRRTATSHTRHQLVQPAVRLIPLKGRSPARPRTCRTWPPISLTAGAVWVSTARRSRGAPAPAGSHQPLKLLAEGPRASQAHRANRPRCPDRRARAPKRRLSSRLARNRPCRCPGMSREYPARHLL